MDWDQFFQWLLTAFLGAVIVKLLDLAASRILKRQARKEESIAKLSALLDDYAELVELYRFMANTSSRIITDGHGQFMKDEHGKYVFETRVLEPKERFDSAIKNLQGSDIKSAIAQKIAAIQLKSASAQDISILLDPSGGLEERLRQLYLDTVISIDSVIDSKDTTDPGGTFNRMVDALNKANNTRRNVRAELQTFLDK